MTQPWMQRSTIEGLAFNDPRVFRGLPRGSLNTKEGQVVANDGSVGSPMQSTSSKNCRKRKGLSSSGPANSTGTGNTIGPSPNSQPSTPSTHMPGDGVSMASNVQHVGDDGDGRDAFGKLKQNPTEPAAEHAKGFPLVKWVQ